MIAKRQNGNFRLIKEYIYIANILKVGLSPTKKICFICFSESPLKMMKNAFYSTLKALFVFKVLNFCPEVLIKQKKWLGQNDKVNFKIYGVKTQLRNHCNTHIVQYFTKLRQSELKFGLLIEYNKMKFGPLIEYNTIFFFKNHAENEAGRAVPLFVF